MKVKYIKPHNNYNLTIGNALEIAKQIVADILLLNIRKILQVNVKQNKTHKKYRINKKWAKRYGYTCIVFYE